MKRKKRKEVKILKKPVEPTQKEWEEHMVLHWPFRSWCPHGVNGKAQGEWHRQATDKEEQGIPTISMDYTYMIAEDNKDKEDKTIRGMPILVIKDTMSGYIAAQVVLNKGECGHAIEFAIQFLDFLGYKRIVLKTDQEESRMSLKMR